MYIVPNVQTISSMLHSYCSLCMTMLSSDKFPGLGVKNLELEYISVYNVQLWNSFRN